MAVINRKRDKQVSISLVTPTHTPLMDDTMGSVVDGVITVNSLLHPRKQALVRETLKYFAKTWPKQDVNMPARYWKVELPDALRVAMNEASKRLVSKDKLMALMDDGVTSVSELAKELDVTGLTLRMAAKSYGFKGHGLD